MEDVCAFNANRFEPGQSNGPCDARVVLDPRHRRGDRNHARGAQDNRAICQARGGSQNVRRPDAIHAFESELRRRDADHLCLGTAFVPGHHRELRI